MKIFLTLVLILGVLHFSCRVAASDYRLPYPSYMPGNKLYTLSRLLDSLNEWWYWGNVAKVKYYLKLTDKYLVEAKTLFEYEQYLLATEALERSDKAFSHVPFYLERAKKEGKDTAQLKKTVYEAVEEHKRTIVKIQTEIPKNFMWTPEKKDPTFLPLEDRLNDSIFVLQRIAEKSQSL